ncbi:MAG: flagellar motor protein MotB, partial [Chitinophagaceae bacterium]
MKIPYILFFLLCAFSYHSCLQAQSYDPAKVNPKAVALYTQARERAEGENYASAAGLLQQAISLDKNYVDAYLALGSVFGTLKNYQNSVNYFEQAFAIDPVYTINYRFSYAGYLAGLGQFEKA